MGQKCVFPKMILDHLGCTNKWNEPIASHFGPSKVTKCLENGLFWDRSKMDQKCVFPKIILDYLGCTDKWNEPIVSPC